jgi:acid phosphatase family membrane protein YuiD
MSDFSQIVANKALLIPIVAWIIAQILKTIIQSLRDRHFNIRYMVSAGGMPSAHTALVSSLATTIGIVFGIGSGLFAISAVLAFVVMYDATGVRQAVDKQSAVLNHLMDNFPKTKHEFEYILRQLVGHTRLQVTMGAILGVLLAVWLA